MPDIEPKNREEIFLKNITRTLGGDDPVEIEPHNRQEHFLHNIAVALGADGVATDIEPNKRIEYLYKNIESIASASRNRVQVIESTMANPLGDLDPEELIPKLTNPFEDEIPSGATGFLSIDATALGVGYAFGFIYASGSTGVQTNGADMVSDSATCFSAGWYYGEITPTVNWIFMGQIPGDGTGAVMDVSAYAENLPTKLTIVWHDLNGGAGSGGGNPNRVQTITGTMATIAHDIFVNIPLQPIDFLYEIANGNASASMSVDGSAIGGPTTESCPIVAYTDTTQLYWNVVQSSWGDSSVSFLAATFVSISTKIAEYVLGAMAIVDQSGNATDIRPYASMLPYTLTIIWHPLPN